MGNTADWELLKQQLSIGTVLSGRIFARTIYGIFFDVGMGFPAQMNVTDFGIVKKDGTIFPDDYPALCSEISGRFAGFDDDDQRLKVVRP